MGAVACSAGGLTERDYNLGKRHFREALEENNLQRKVELLISSGRNLISSIKNVGLLPPKDKKRDKLLKIKVMLTKICEFLRIESNFTILNKMDREHKADFESQILLFELQERFYVFHEVIENLEF